MESHIMGDLAPELAEQLETHLRQCDACQRRYEEQKRLIALLRRVFATSDGSPDAARLLAGDWNAHAMRRRAAGESQG